MLRGAVFFNALRPDRQAAAFNPGAVAGLHLNVAVCNCSSTKMFTAPRRRVALHAAPCASGTVAEDLATGVVECRALPDPSSFRTTHVGVAEFRVDLGRIGQGAVDIGGHNVAIEIGDTRGSIYVTSQVADPQVADVGAVEEDAGAYEDARSGLDWARAVLDSFNESSPKLLAAAPTLPSDDTYSTLGVADARFAPPRLAPSARIPTKRVVQVWRTLPRQMETRPRLIAVLVEHFLRSGGTAVAAYVSPEAAAPLSASSALRPLVERGELLLVRWEGVDRPLGWSAYDRLFLNAHAMLSLWGRNAIALVSEVDEVVSLPGAEPELGSFGASNVSALPGRVAPFSASPRLRPCPAQRSGYWAAAGVSSLLALSQRRRWPCTPSEGLARPTPRQERLAKVLGAGGCMHELEARQARRLDPIREALLQPPRCAQISGFPVFLLGHSSEKPAGIDGEQIEEAGSMSGAFSAHWREETTVRRRRPFFDPDAVLPPNVNAVIECVGRRTQRWGPSPPGGLGPPVPLEKLPNGTWDLASVDVSQSLSNANEDAPVIEAPCRLTSSCKDAPEECLQLRRLVNLYGINAGTRDTSQWRAARRDWLWVWTDGFKSAAARADGKEETESME